MKIEQHEFECAISSSFSIREALIKMKYSPTGANYIGFKQLVAEWGIDISHFNGGYKKGGRYRFRSTPLNEILVENSSYTSKAKLKQRIMQNGLLTNECQVCGQKPEWNGQPLVLVLDHINGHNNDHRLENLRLLCPNCNSQMPTFAGRNISFHHCETCNRRMSYLYHKEQKVCFSCEKKMQKQPKMKVEKKCQCGNVMRPSAKQCWTCYNKSRFKKFVIDEKLLADLVWQKPTTQIAKEYGVSDKTIEKRCKKLGISKPPNGY